MTSRASGPAAASSTMAGMMLTTIGTPSPVRSVPVIPPRSERRM
jgi:hypothetical protein